MRYTLLLLVVTGLFACKQKTDKQFKISGNIKNAKSEMIYLQETSIGSGQRLIVDSMKIKSDGSFSLKAKPQEETLFHIYTKDSPYVFLFLINDVPEVKVTADILDVNASKVEGSPATNEALDFFKQVDVKWKALNNLSVQSDTLSGKPGSDSLVNELNLQGGRQSGELKNYIHNFITSSKSPVSSLLALGIYAQFFSQDEYNQLLNTVAANFPKHKGVASIKQINDQRDALTSPDQQQSSQWVGKAAPELTLPDVDDNTVTLSSFRGKYVLVDFWASWCQPCRVENPNVVKAYNKYKSKNFTILGVSLDKEKDNWLKAILKDKLVWTQVSDLKEWGSAAVTTYGLTAIPFNVLIDPEGKIIAEGLHGADLDAKLNELLK